MSAFVNLLDVVYPVGSVYQSFDSTSPATLFGGTWTNVDYNTYLVSSGTDTNSITGNTVGKNSLTVNFAHNHYMTLGGSYAKSWKYTVNSWGVGYHDGDSAIVNRPILTSRSDKLLDSSDNVYYGPESSYGGTTRLQLGNKTWDNRPASIFVRIWKRTA